MQSDMNEFFGCGIDGITLRSFHMNDMDSPFDPSIGINVINGEGDEEFICQMNLTSARRLAYQILADCESGMGFQDADLEAERMVEEGLLPESEHPTNKILDELNKHASTGLTE